MEKPPDNNVAGEEVLAREIAQLLRGGFSSKAAEIVTRENLSPDVLQSPEIQNEALTNIETMRAGPSFSYVAKTNNMAGSEWAFKGFASIAHQEEVALIPFQKTLDLIEKHRETFQVPEESFRAALTKRALHSPSEEVLILSEAYPWLKDVLEKKKEKSDLQKFDPEI